MDDEMKHIFCSMYEQMTFYMIINDAVYLLALKCHRSQGAKYVPRNIPNSLPYHLWPELLTQWMTDPSEIKTHQYLT